MNPVGAENQSYLGQTEAAPEKTSIAKETLGNILNVNDELGLPGVKISEDHSKLQEINKKVKRSSQDCLVNSHTNKKICLECNSQNEQNIFATCPDEIILSIFSKLNLKDQSKVAMVSSQFKTLTNDQALGLMKFKSSYSTCVLENAFEKDFQELEKDKFIEKFSAELNCVQELDLSSFDLSSDILKLINEFCPNIKKLSLPTSTTDELLKFLPEKLVSLDLAGCKITDTGLSHLTSLKKLESLNLTWCAKITDTGLSHLAPLKNLASLNLTWCVKITDTGLSHLAPLKNLASLNLAWCNEITDTGLSYLAPLKKLVSLNLKNCKKITDAGLSHLAPLKNLASLNLAWCTKITDTGLSHLVKLKNLVSLDLAFCTKITDEGLSHFTSLKKLESLNLTYCNKITDAGLSYLVPLKNLES